MAYRRTAKVEAHQARIRRRIVTSAVGLIARDGYRSAQVARIAGRARVASGTVYTHFPSKAELCAEVFRTVCGGELAAVRDAATTREAAAPARIAHALEAFARRALAARRLAYALLVEPVDLAVERERLAFRRAYVALFAGIIADGIAEGSVPPQEPEITAASVVGAMGEALVGPLASTVRGRDDEALIAAVVGFCMRAITGKEHPHVRASRENPVPRHARGPEPGPAARGVRRLRARPGARRRRRT